MPRFLQAKPSAPHPSSSSSSSSSSSRFAGASVGIGDGLGDLAMLLETDVPIVLSPSSSFRRACARFGLRLEPLLLASGLPAKRSVLVATDWSELLAVLCWTRPEAATARCEARRRGCRAEECRLMALTSDALNGADDATLERAVLASVAGGATMVQLRDKTEDFGSPRGDL